LALHSPLLALAGLCGAVGVALAAAGSHAADANLAIAANFLLFHAPALIALSLLRGNRLAGIAGWVLAVGLVLFAGDLVMRAKAGTPLFPFAAPLGGGALILGWLLVTASAFWRGRAS
jgi:uncharacterized membrane protein YgdD (TMEM256/DUF423 family)